MKIAIYADNAPVREDVLASGMNRVNRRLFLSLINNISTVVIPAQQSNIEKSDFDKSLSEIIVLPNLNYLFVKLMNKISKKIEKLFGKSFDILFFFNHYKFVKVLKNSKADYLFVPLGADIRGYQKAIKLAKRTRLPLIVYIVDEFMSASVLSNDKIAQSMCAKYLSIWLNETSKIFVISEGMQNFLQKNYGVKSSVLNLPFEKKFTKVSIKTRKTILFLGNVSHFYQDGLNDLLQALYEYNKNSKEDVYLRLTVNKLPDSINKKYRQFIKYSHIEGDQNLANEISNSLFCFIPYSFEKKYQTMVSTSFPSKTLECLAYAKHILVYGPQYSSAINYFEKNELTEVISERDQSLLYKYILDRVRNSNVLFDEYNKVLNKNHNFHYIKHTFLEQLNEKKVINRQVESR